MPRKFKVLCIKADPLNWLEVGKVYEVQQWNGKTIVGDGAFSIDSSRFKEHFVLFHEGNTKGGEQ